MDFLKAAALPPGLTPFFHLTDLPTAKVAHGNFCLLSQYFIAPVSPSEAH